MWVAFLIIPFLFTACASKPIEAQKPACEQVDWYELGRRDGSQGTPTDQLNKHQKECSKIANADWETIYTNGRNAGLVEFCDPKNGYELGRMGISYYFVCPSTVEAQFLVEYRKGQQTREIELQNQKLDEQIEELAQKLIKTDSLNEQKEIATELEELKKLRAKNEETLNKITK